MPSDPVNELILGHEYEPCGDEGGCPEGYDGYCHHVEPGVPSDHCRGIDCCGDTPEAHHPVPEGEGCDAE
jgi:hypothetical protein